VTKTSPLILSFPLSLIVVGGLGTVGITKTVLEVGVLEEEATYRSQVLSVGLFSGLTAYESSSHR
jgi:hypothetical protein